MRALLSKVREAREKASAQFLKDLAIHEMAAVIKGVLPDVINAAIAQRANPGDYIRAENLIPVVHKIFTTQMLMAVEQPRPSPELIRRVGGEATYAIAKAICNDPDSRLRYTRVIEHIRSFEDMVKAYPLNPADRPIKLVEKIGRAIKQFESLIPSAIDRAENMFRRQRRGFCPEILTFQGGGAKGMSYAGVEEILTKAGITSNVKYVAGTSAGALLGLLVSMGFESQEINSIVRNGQFAQFFAQSSQIFKLMAAPGLIIDRWRGTLKPEDHPYLEGFNLSEFAEKFMLPRLVKQTGIARIDLIMLKDTELDSLLRDQGANLDALYRESKDAYERHLISSGRVNEVDVIKFSGLPGRSESLQACATSVRCCRESYHPENDMIESYLADIIEIAVSRYIEKNPASEMAKTLTSKEKMRAISFTELQGLAQESNYQSFKEFGVAITESHIMTLGWFPRAYDSAVRSVKSLFGKVDVKDSAHQIKDEHANFKPVFARAGGGDYVDMPVKTAVRASMNLPFVFDTMRYKGKKHFDGGMIANNPFSIFLDKFGDDPKLAEEKTIGFVLSTIDSDMESLAIDDMAKVAKKQMAIELERYPEGFINKAKTASVEFGIFLYSLGLNLGSLRIGDAASQIKSLLTAPLGKAAGWMVESIMDKYNAALPSEQILENTGVVNTGMVKTEQFHLSADQKDVLISAGKRAALSILSDHSDRHLRFSKDRLSSLINIENELCEKMGEQSQLQIPALAMNDARLLAQALNDAFDKEVSFGDLLSGSLPSTSAHYQKPMSGIDDREDKKHDDRSLKVV